MYLFPNYVGVLVSANYFQNMITYNLASAFYLPVILFKGFKDVIKCLQRIQNIIFDVEMKVKALV